MRAFVESLKRLYKPNGPVVNDARLDQLLADGKITEDELIYIKTGKL